MTERQHTTWGELLRDAVEKPGRLLEAYTAFHNYSFGNALLALEQCIRRNLQPGPPNTYRAWLERKRQVRKGETGITLCMPMPFRPNAQALNGAISGYEKQISGRPTYQESRGAAGVSFPPRYVRDDSAGAHVKHKRERYTEYRNNQHGLLKASGAESFRDRG